MLARAGRRRRRSPADGGPGPGRRPLDAHAGGNPFGGVRLRPVVLGLVRGVAVRRPRPPRRRGIAGRAGRLLRQGHRVGRVQLHDEQAFGCVPPGCKITSRRWPALSASPRRRRAGPPAGAGGAGPDGGPVPAAARPGDPVLPRARRAAAVRLPVWLWVAPAAWQPQSKTAQVPGEPVTATATPVLASWPMGDGRTVTCHGPGIPYAAGTTRRRRRRLRPHLRPVQRRAAGRRLQGDRHDHLGHHLARRRRGGRGARAAAHRGGGGVPGRGVAGAQHQRRMTMAVPARSRRAPARPRPAPRRMRRRSVPLAAAGVLLVVGCALVFAVGWLQAGHRQPVLALAQPVAAGQVITAADLRWCGSARPARCPWSLPPGRPPWRAARRRAACPRAAC